MRNYTLTGALAKSQEPLHPDRLLPAEPGERAIARRLYDAVRDLPVISPHGHVDPRLLLDNEPFPDPATLFVTPGHYVTRLLASPCGRRPCGPPWTPGTGVQELPPGGIGAPFRCRGDLQGLEDSADGGCADSVAEFQQLALDRLVSPAVVLGGEPFDQRGDLGADRGPSRPVRVGPLAGTSGIRKVRGRRS